MLRVSVTDLIWTVIEDRGAARPKLGRGYRSRNARSSWLRSGASPPLISNAEEIDMIGRVVSSGSFKTGVAVLASAVIASVATVSITDAAGAGSSAITACVTNTTGDIVILSDPTGSTAATCPSKGAHELAWNQEGATGAQGPQGPQGAAGSPGLGLGSSSSAISAELSSALSSVAALSSQIQGDRAQELDLFRVQQRFAALHIPEFAASRATIRKLAGSNANELFASIAGSTTPFGIGWPSNGSLKTIEPDLNSMSDLSEMESMQLQMEMDRYSKALQSLSNLMKAIAEGEAAIVSNIKS
jgi:hypothetical protein